MTVDLALHDCGPCDTAGPAVRDHLPATLTPEARAFILTRLDHGEAHYGAPLRIGWPGAVIEAPQESADLVAYLRAANAPQGLIDRAAALHNDVVRWAQAAPPPRRSRSLLAAIARMWNGEGEV